MKKISLIMLMALTAFAVATQKKALINGKPVDPSDKLYHPVVRIKTGSSGCTGTVIGPKVLLTAGHCGGEGATTTFMGGSTEYKAVIERHPLYPGKDIDFSLAIMDKTWAHSKPASITTDKTAIKETITLLGYGCTQQGGGGGNDGTLREGNTTVTSYNNYDIVSYARGGGALCFGDSGGPGFFDKKVFGVNSKGNIKDTNYSAALHTAEAKSFLASFTKKHSAEICGFNKNCEKPPNATWTWDNAEMKMTVEDKPKGHNEQYLRNYSKMLADFFISGDSTPICDGTVQPPIERYCSCGTVQKVLCDDTGYGYCLHDFYCRCL